jgi:hypothetical protein
MRYKGELHYVGSSDPGGAVTSAIITKERIRVEWDETGYPAVLEARPSVDGQTFSGVFTYSGSDNRYTCEVKKYTSNGEILLFGDWRRTDIDDHGRLVFVLRPVDAVAETP